MSKNGKPSHGWVLIIGGGGAPDENVPQFWDWDELCEYAWDSIQYRVDDEFKGSELLDLKEWPEEFIRRCDVKVYGLEYKHDDEGKNGPFLAYLPWKKWFKEAQLFARECVAEELESAEKRALKNYIYDTVEERKLITDSEELKLLQELREENNRGY